jgi:hypothetical protein
MVNNCLEVVVIRFVVIGGIVDHHCLGVVVIRFVDIGGITNINKANNNNL